MPTFINCFIIMSGEIHIMKSKVLLLVLTGTLLTGCSLFSPSSDNQPIDSSEDSTTSTSTSASTSDSTSSSTSSGGNSSSSSTGEDIPPDTNSIQNMTILHAWNWKLNDVKSRLSAIKEAGYGAIQLSPMQPKVDKTNWSNQSTKSQWWKLYQPLAFQIAENNETFLGTKNDLISLCSEAKRYGIKIVMDVVSNHLAGSNTTYSDQVYTRYPLHSYTGGANDDSVQAVVQGHIGLPDLDTSKDQVQQDVLSLLKSYIDCGVSGFRFDAAKHIETPDDGAYASEYWPTILNGATTYANSKNLAEPYYYGEILNTCGTGRSFSSYIKYMSVCDNKQGTAIVNAVNNKSLSDVKSTFDSGVKQDHLVLWAESHDTYANDSGYEKTRDFSTETINKAYMIQASRKDAATLYLGRPSSIDTTICTVDENSGWKNAEIAAINKFHALYVGQKETISKNNGCFVNIRGESKDAGAVIVSISNNSSVTVDVAGLNNGTYVDLISKAEFTVNNSKATVSFTAGGCILVPKDVADTPEDPPVVDEQYDSSVVLKGYQADKAYLAWVWNSGSDGQWKAFSTDHDAIGLNLNNGDNYIIVEFPSGTTVSTANWSNKIKQTNDLLYSGQQIIHEYSSLTWKS